MRIENCHFTMSTVANFNLYDSEVKNTYIMGEEGAELAFCKCIFNGCTINASKISFSSCEIIDTEIISEESITLIDHNSDLVNVKTTGSGTIKFLR